MNTILKIIGLGTIGVFILFASFCTFIGAGSINKQKVFIPFIYDIVMPVVASFDMKLNKEIMTIQAANAMADEDLERFLSHCRDNFGDLVNFQEPILLGSKDGFMIGSGYHSTANYQINTEFKKEAIMIFLTLVHKEGETKVQAINFRSSFESMYPSDPTENNEKKIEQTVGD